MRLTLSTWAAVAKEMFEEAGAQSVGAVRCVSLCVSESA
jgi:threonine/homoserine efflux transporter RhtA